MTRDEGRTRQRAGKDTSKRMIRRERKVDYVKEIRRRKENKDKL